MKGNIKTNNITYRVAFTGIIIAISIIFRFASIMIPFASVAALRIDLSTPFMKLPGIIFGPVIGAISGGIVDLLGYFLKPMGAYIPWFTITSMMVCVFTAILWYFVRGIDNSILKKVSIYSFSILGILGLVTTINKILFTNSFITSKLNLLGDKVVFVTYLLLIVSFIGFIFLYISNKIENSEFYKLLLVLCLPAILHTTLNTIILREYFISLANKGFLVLWIPRVMEELFMIPIEAYIISLLLSIYKKLKI